MAYTTANEATQARPANMASIVADLDPIIHRLVKVANHLDRIADRIEGSRPEGVGTVEGQPTPSSLIYELQRKRESLAAMCDRLENEANRIDRALGNDPLEIKSAGINRQSGMNG